ncbi:hypothetical protein [Hymenobacter psychrotolerans]|uniref:Outer membrane protein beta-barrel domain-containing protein n=1 Tax=Hymenobacter psychrotolerans DSM 18569 TaxID=1121959 RepID=A0A1M7GV13_9BACT|nr:hypothetical protein [Hymenobacter psychrotolerans]SHM20090.1 hypothetical protein SAMN02746009_04113 [Hymenobacter psychrotolerans DSM 18569]
MKALLLAAGGLSLTGCAVYVPTTPTTPLLRNKGEVELTAGLRGSSLEAGAAWSPAGRLLLTAESALKTSNGSETRNSVTFNYHNLHRQAGLGVGTYRLLGKEQATYLAAVGGIGFAKADIYDPNFNLLFFSGPLVHYQANYRRYYGQVYVARQLERVSFGMSLRGTLVDYSRLRRDSVAVQPSSRFYVEPTWFVRVGRGALQGQATFGFSAPIGADRTQPDHRNLTPVTALIGVGVVFRPHLLKQ